MTLPEGWIEAPLGDLTSKIGSGATPRGGRETYGSSGVPLIRSMNVHFGAFRRDGLAFLDDQQAKVLENVEVHADDVLLNITGASIGRVCVAPDEMIGARVNQHVCIIRAAGDMSAKFLEAFLAAPEIQRYIVAENYGLTRQALTKRMIEQIAVALPPVAEQRRIVTRLDALTARLTCARAGLARVPVLADRLRDAALTSTIAALADYPAVSVADVAISMFDGPFGSNLKSVDYTANGARVVRLENIGHLRFLGDRQTYISLDKYEALTRHRLHAGDILFSSFVDREVRVCRFPEGIEEPAINKADCFVIRLDNTKCDGEFLTYLLAAPATYQVMKDAVHGATRPRIGLTHLKNYVINLPPMEKQRVLVAQLDSAFARADRLEAEAARASALLDRLESAILAKAFQGELVPQDPSDEPASMLLERIRGRRAATPQPKRGRRAAGAKAA